MELLSRLPWPACWRLWRTQMDAQPSPLPRTEQPLSLEVSQSTRNCSLRDTSSPVASLLAPSIAPVVENAQQEPHCRV